MKASRGPSWQFGKVTSYCDIAFAGKRQIIGKKKPCPVHRLIMVFVRINENGNDHFYILPWEPFRDLLVARHSIWLDKHGGIRPKKWDSLHCAIPESALSPYQDKWETIEKSLK